MAGPADWGATPLEGESSGPAAWGATPLSERPLFGTDEYVKSMAKKHGIDEDTVRTAAHAQYSGHVLQGVAGTVGLGSLVPKAGAAISAAAAPVTGKGFQAGSFGERYGKERDLEQELARDYETDHPIMSTASELGGAALTGTGLVRAGAGPLIGAVEGGLGRQATISGLTNAAYGALDATLRGEEPTSEAALSGAIGLAGPVVGKVAGNAINATRNMIRPPGPATPENMILGATRPIRTSSGFASGDIGAQREEQAGARGALGPEAQQSAQTMFGRPNEPYSGMTGEDVLADRNAVAGLMDRTPGAGQGLRAQTPLEGSQGVIDAVTDAFHNSRRNYNQLYETASQIPGDIHASAFDRFTEGIQHDLSSRADPVIINRTITPVAAEMLQMIDQNISRLRVPNAAMPGGAPNPNSIVGINMQGVEQMRKMLVQVGKAATYNNPADQRAVSAVRKAFDDGIESALDRGLFTGQADAALDAFRDARQAYATHASLFKTQAGDQGIGRLIENITGQRGMTPASPNDVANWLYNSTKVGATQKARLLAQRIGDIVGRNSEAYVAMKQGLWSRLVEAPEGKLPDGPQKIYQRIFEFLNGSGATVAQELFTQQERVAMWNFARMMRQLTPLPGAVNYSGTAYALPMMVRHMFSHVLGAIGAGMLGPLGAVGHIAGYATGHQIGQRMVEKSSAGRVTRSLFQSPATQRAEERLAQQWGQHGAVISRAVNAGTHPVAATAGRQAPDGHHYVPDPVRPGMYLRLDDGRGAAR